MPVYCVRKKPCCYYSPPKSKFRGRTFKDFHTERFLDAIKGTDWENFWHETDVNCAWGILFNRIRSLANIHAPFRTYYAHPIKPPWYHEDLLSSSIERDHLFKKAKYTNKPIDLKKARNKRSQVRSEVLAA